MVRARSPHFFFLFYFFLLSSFPSSFLFHLPGAAASPRRLHFSFCFCFSFYFFFLFFLLLFLLFSFCFFSLYFYSDFLFLFFLCPFFLLFLSFYFCSYLCFFCLSFLSLLLLFFFLSFFLFYFFTLLSYSTAIFHTPSAIHFFSPPPPIFPIPSSHFPAAAKRKKISAKESTGVEWPPGSERAAGGKAEGRNEAPSGMEKRLRKICILREKR